MLKPRLNRSLINFPELTSILYLLLIVLLSAEVFLVEPELIDPEKPESERPFLKAVSTYSFSTSCAIDLVTETPNKQTENTKTRSCFIKIYPL